MIPKKICRVLNVLILCVFIYICINLFDSSYTHIDEPSEVIDTYSVRRDALLELTLTRPVRTIEQIFAMESRYNVSKKSQTEFSLTVIVSMYKRNALVERWIGALLEQTHLPKEIWFVYFASPVAEDIDAEIASARVKFSDKLVKHGITVLASKGDMQLKYFGRFQLALQVKTKYVVIFDDDCIPQKRYLEAAMFTIKYLLLYYIILYNIILFLIYINMLYTK